ncbi:uncharacterized protein BT62DRAFT_574245 [Guyanagaster necrorhizus]|uniref:Uncharacterized protein n=1 Tax=Guyanagaster necrorhizus TaxID=856835 RepID=A0A9P8AME0_9AGAR|nr:uncharacterized protein BT62DRAFT_574245 [Guyanagaster necrorhizus MCA 3950]KAG7440795.1 hypothetical protein BT62DRAFT_574245 [Guyanagaster necrorhizus MCA 3950]
MGGFLWFVAGAAAATIYCNGRIQAGYYAANPNGYYERGWVRQNAPFESDEKVPEGEERERRYAYGAGVRLEGQQRFGLEVPQRQRERPEVTPPPPLPPQQEEQPSLERIRELSKQADEAMSELSEATLDSLMAIIIAAKNVCRQFHSSRPGSGLIGL